MNKGKRELYTRFGIMVAVFMAMMLGAVQCTEINSFRDLFMLKKGSFDANTNVWELALISYTSPQFWTLLGVMGLVTVFIVVC